MIKRIIFILSILLVSLLPKTLATSTVVSPIDPAGLSLFDAQSHGNRLMNITTQNSGNRLILWTSTFNNTAYRTTIISSIGSNPTVWNIRYQANLTQNCPTGGFISESVYWADVVNPALYQANVTLHSGTTTSVFYGIFGINGIQDWDGGVLPKTECLTGQGANLHHGLTTTPTSQPFQPLGISFCFCFSASTWSYDNGNTLLSSSCCSNLMGYISSIHNQPISNGWTGSSGATSAWFTYNDILDTTNRVISTTVNNGLVVMTGVIGIFLVVATLSMLGMFKKGEETWHVEVPSAKGDLKTVVVVFVIVAVVGAFVAVYLAFGS